MESARPRNNLSTSTNHGGVCLFYGPSLYARTVQLPVFATFEAVAAFIHRAGFKAVVVVVYRPGSCSVTQTFYDDFSDMLERLSTFSAPLMIAGDFNIHVDDETDVHAGKLTDLLACHSLRQHVAYPTHAQGHTLDLVITRDDQSIALLPVDPPLLSDHSFVVADCDHAPPSTTSTSFRPVRNWRALDVDAFAADLQSSELLATPIIDVESGIDSYNTTLRSLLDKHAPVELKRIKTSSTSARWFDRECRNTKRYTRKLERQYRRLRTAESERAWRQQFDAQRRLFQSKFTTFWLETVNSCGRNSRELWRVVDALLQPPPQRTSENLSADHFAQYFRGKVDSIRSSTASADPPVLVTRDVPPLSCFRPATVPEIIKLLKDTPAKSCELDPVPTWLLKQLASYIAPTISRLCNLSMKSGVFPAQLKQARVLPLLKKPSLDPDVAASYRPISNLSYLSKLIERVVATRFAEHSSTNNLLPVQQSAYRPFHSTETAIVSVHNDLVRTVDSGKMSLLILLDLSAAFDTVDHTILLSVLADRFSIDSTALSWFQSYLTDRTQTFVYAAGQTPNFPVDCSVPQGSVLGPRCFISYTEDLADLLDKHAVLSHLYADDTQFHASCRPDDTDSLRTRLSSCANDIISWCMSRRLQLNASKTEAIWVGSRSSLAKLSVIIRSRSGPPRSNPRVISRGNAWERRSHC